VLRQLVYDGIISKDDAITHANNKFMFEHSEESGGPPPAEGAGRRPTRPETPADRASPARPAPSLPPSSSAAPPSPSVEVEEDWMKIFGRKK